MFKVVWKCKMFISNTSKTAGVESGYVDVGYQVNV